MNNKLSEINGKLKNKILKFEAPNCKIKYLQVGPNWLKFAFKKNDKITFGLKFDKFVVSALENPRMNAKLTGHADTGRIRLDYSDKDNTEYVTSICLKLKAALDSARAMAEERMQHTIIDIYGFSELISMLAYPVYPDGISAVEGNAYTFGVYDPISESEKWYPAIQPVGYFAEPIEKSEDAVSYDDYDFPLIGFTDDIKPLQED